MPELAPSRTGQMGRVLAYLTGAMIGVSLVVRTPEVIEKGTIGVVAIALAYVMLLVGCVATVAAVSYLYLIEYVCLVLLATIVAVCMVTFYGWALTHNGVGTVIGLFLQMLLAFIISRFGELNRLVKFQKRGGD